MSPAPRAADGSPPAVLTRPLRPRRGAALDPLVEECSAGLLQLASADPAAIVNRADLVVAANSFARVLERIWVPGATYASCELASTVGRSEEPALHARLLLGRAGPRGTTAAETADLLALARRTLAAHPAPFSLRAADPADLLEVVPIDTALITQRVVSTGTLESEASVVSRWDRDASSWLELARAVLDRPGTRIRTTLLSTELGVEDIAWLRAQLNVAQQMVKDSAETDPDLHRRASRVLVTLTDMLESYRTPLFCAEVAVISEVGPLTDAYLREVGGSITTEFDVMHRGETPLVAARARWVGGYEIERNVDGLAEGLALGLPTRGGLGPRRLVDVLSLTEASCAFQWPIPAGGLVPTIPGAAARLLPAPPGLAQAGANIGASASGRPLHLAWEDRSGHVHILGVTGSGKSTVLDRLGADDISAGRRFMAIDRHGPLVDRYGRRLELAGRPYVLIDPSSPATARMALFPRRPDGSIDDDQMGRANSRLIHAVTAHLPADFSGPRFRDSARNALMVVGHAGANLRSVGLLLADRSHAMDLIDQAREMGSPVPGHVVRWIEAHHMSSNTDRAGVAQWVGSKFDELANSSTLPKVIDTTGAGIDLGAEAALGTPVLVNLGATDEIEARLLGSMALGSALEAAFDLGPDLVDEWSIIVDEAQKFYVENLERALNEARKFGVSLTLAHQHLRQFEPRPRDAVLGSCSLGIAFRLAEDDADRLAPRFGIRSRDLSSQPNLQCVVHRADLGAEQSTYSCIVAPYEDLEGEEPGPVELWPRPTSVDPGPPGARPRIVAPVLDR